MVRAVRLGGNWYNGSNDGFSYANANNAPANGNANYGGDLYIVPSVDSPMVGLSFIYYLYPHMWASSFPRFFGTEIDQLDLISSESENSRGKAKNMKRLNHILDHITESDGVRAVKEGTATKRQNRAVNKLLAEDGHQIDSEKAKAYANPIIEQMKDGTYIHHSPRHKRQFCKSSGGGKWRDLYIPTLRDHIMHHILMDASMEAFTRNMHPHCCGSVPGRGIKHIVRCVRHWTLHDKQCRYFVKLDITKFFRQYRQGHLKAETA